MSTTPLPHRIVTEDGKRCVYYINQRGTQWVLCRYALTEHGFATNHRRVSGHETEDEAMAALALAPPGDGAGGGEER